LGVTREHTLDGFLGGRLSIAQPRKGFRAGHDTVLLAASVPAAAGAQVLELGAGAGVASLCLAWRVPGASVTGREIDPELVALANENAERNGMADRVRFERGDAASLGGGRTFDHVFFNPPFHPASGEQSPSQARDVAMRDAANALADWTRNALALTRPEGTVTAILRADRAEEMLGSGDAKGTVLFPLFPRAGEAPKRTIIQFQKGSLEPRRVAAGLILHEQDGRNSEAAEAVLRHGAILRLV
jgi:tRNA1(Val) A37 N6-methylase TrmN6